MHRQEWQRERVDALQAMALVTSGREAGLVLVPILVAACSGVHATYRASNADPLAEELCLSLSDRGTPQPLEAGWFRCTVLHEVAIEVKQTGDLLRVRTPDCHLNTRVALVLGRIAHEHNISVELVELNW